MEDSGSIGSYFARSEVTIQENRSIGQKAALAKYGVEKCRKFKGRKSR